jgi:ATP-dependent RNA helicase SUPV3L1/SUV3
MRPRRCGRRRWRRLRPEFHLRADRLYNAPDTAFEMTEEGGLSGGDRRRAAGGRAEAMKPTAEAFVEEDAGAEVILKVQRRLQHFVDRKIAAQFEPLLAMARDEAITGLARGVAFRLVEGYGIVPRAEIADDIKALDQDARGLAAQAWRALRAVHDLPAAPAEARADAPAARALGAGEGARPCARQPAAGSGDDPARTERPEGYYTMSGYRPAASRAIRIDMLERLADMLRGQDTRGGFEATADMLSITGLTLEQFADLMGGLGYKAERGERPKVKAAPDRLRNPRPRTRRRPWTRRCSAMRRPRVWKGPTRPIRRRRRSRSEPPTKRRTLPPGKRPPTCCPRRRPRRQRKFRATRPPRSRRRPRRRSRSSTHSPGRRNAAAAIVRSVVPRAAAASPVARSRRAAASRGKARGGKGGKDRQDGPRTFTAKPGQARQGRSRQSLRGSGRTQGQVLNEPRPTDRLDRWLWHARFFKTRSLAAKTSAEAACA